MNSNVSVTTCGLSEHAVAESVSCGFVPHASSVSSPFLLAVFNPTWMKHLTLGSPTLVSQHWLTIKMCGTLILICSNLT